jgi:RHS repeat-associated protein
VTYLHPDHLGTPRIGTSTAGAISWRYRSDGFGVATISGTHTVRLRLPGQIDLGTGGINYNYFRDYDPNVGRYLESDPVGLGGGINTYSYVGDNPIKLIDEDGLMGHGPGRPPYSPGQGPGTMQGPFGTACGVGPSAHWIPDGPWKTACENHDKCYSRCGASRLQCDLNFLAESGNIYYFLAVRARGHGPYVKAQQHCNSCGDNGSDAQ